MSQSFTTVELRSLLKADGELELSLVDVPITEPKDDEIVVRIQAAPINPSDLGLLFGWADPSKLHAAGTAERPVVTTHVSPEAMKGMAARVGSSMSVGNEGAGVVVAAGSSVQAQALLGKTVAVLGGSMYTTYRKINVGGALVLPDGATAADGASSFVNPLTALSMVDTMRAEGHTAIVHTAAASNLGQMLVKICLEEGVGLVNVVRSAQQVETLHAIGATHVCDSSAPTFADDLVAAISATGATIGFDAVGGGPLASQILNAMEASLTADVTAANYSRYGSTVHKQVYIYGALDTRPTELTRGFGFAWGVGGYLLTPFLLKAGAKRVAELKARVAAGIKTTFASTYTRTISLAEALDPKIIAEYAKRATGEKFLIDPSL
jgi:NADPH:quinone reductase-like Zn-dependent oxidoreductase